MTTDKDEVFELAYLVDPDMAWTFLLGLLRRDVSILILAIGRHATEVRMVAAGQPATRLAFATGSVTRRSLAEHQRGDLFGELTFADPGWPDQKNRVG